MIAVSTYRPSPPLAPFVSCYTRGVYNTEARRGAMIEVIPNGCPELIIHLRERHCQLPGGNGLAATPDYMLIGLFRRAFRVHFDEPVPVFTIRFRPEALTSLFQLEGREMLDDFQDSYLLFDKSFHALCDRIRTEPEVTQMIARAEDYLLHRLALRPTRRDYVARSAALMRRCAVCSVADISRQVCISQRQLERQFRRVVGITPKQYLNLLRINRAVEALNRDPNLDLTSVAYDCGYFDQAHFIRDFRRVTGRPPGAYRRGEGNLVALGG
ncbi:AraC-like DNA-binding protein [Lewinella marina]|nr:helix-turn-helix domain-containing protein [Neolewinella marina]NJB85647.1 AraC-like DNA-binding protein [Neolewinella marina]